MEFIGFLPPNLCPAFLAASNICLASKALPLVTCKTTSFSVVLFLARLAGAFLAAFFTAFSATFLAAFFTAFLAAFFAAGLAAFFLPAGRPDAYRAAFRTAQCGIDFSQTLFSVRNGRLRSIQGLLQ